MPISPAGYRTAASVSLREAADPPGATVRIAHSQLTRLSLDCPHIPAAESGAVSYIFHPGFSGSTLVSRLLEAAGGDPLVLREPGSISRMAELDQGSPEYPLHTRLLGRRWHSGQSVVVKAATHCSYLAPGLTDVVFVHTALARYVGRVLSRHRNALHKPGDRLPYTALQSALHPLLLPKWRVLSDGQRATALWFGALYPYIHSGDAVTALDFDVLLKQPAQQMSKLLLSTGVRGLATELVNSTVWQRHAKLGGGYNASVRDAELSRALVDECDGIKEGLIFARELMTLAPELLLLSKLAQMPEIFECEIVTEVRENG